MILHKQINHYVDMWIKIVDRIIISLIVNKNDIHFPYICPIMLEYPRVPSRMCRFILSEGLWLSLSAIDRVVFIKEL